MLIAANVSGTTRANVEPRALRRLILIHFCAASRLAQSPQVQDLVVCVAGTPPAEYWDRRLGHNGVASAKPPINEINNGRYARVRPGRLSPHSGTSARGWLGQADQDIQA